MLLSSENLKEEGVDVDSNSFINIFSREIPPTSSLGKITKYA